VRLTPFPQSIRARSTLATSVLALVVLAVLGATSSAAIRYSVGDRVFGTAQSVASQWSAVARNGALPHAIPTSHGVDLIQVVAADGKVLAASRPAMDLAPLSRTRPPANDRFKRLSENGYMLFAIRISPAVDAPVVYAGSEVPYVLKGHVLEYVLALVGLVLTALVGWTSWSAVGRTLKPVAAIRSRMAEISVTDLSLRMPEPPGEDEIALLVRTANQTLARLEEAVTQQRRFASTTSHELRNPIAGLRVRLEEALLHPDEVDAHDTLGAALSITDRLEAIVGDLLVMARLRSDDPAPRELIDLGELAAEEANRAEGVPVRVHTAADVRVCGSRIQLIRVLGNLLNNARRHAETAVDVSVRSVDGQAVVAVLDDGPGIAPADRERVFERFTRLDDGRRRDSGGSGLGLAISRDIAAGHGGTLRIEDSSRGARFVLRLPLTDAGRATGVAAGPRTAVRADPSRRASALR
jgi:signal transduction histidine kinase